MGPIDFLWHLLSFAAPAASVALLVALAARLLFPRRPETGSWWLHAAINSVAGLIALGAGLWYFGTDGKIASYGALVGAVATSQWICARAWRA